MQSNSLQSILTYLENVCKLKLIFFVISESLEPKKLNSKATSCDFQIPKTLQPDCNFKYYTNLFIDKAKLIEKQLLKKFISLLK